MSVKTILPIGEFHRSGLRYDSSLLKTCRIPPLVFIHTNGTAEAVPQVGGNLAYYLLHGQNISAFPPGFRMIAGNSTLRTFPWPIPDVPQSLLSGNLTSQPALQQRALGFNCLNYNAPGEGSLTRHFLPSKEFIDANCIDGLRLELLFPSCWNGVDVDSPDHKSHVAYASIVMDDGNCPEGFEARIPTLFYETIFNTPEFQNTSGHFVLANGDPTGEHSFYGIPFLLRLTTHSRFRLPR